jgi:hypothetical protein
MIAAVGLLVGVILRLFRARRRLLLENLFLRHQLAVLKRRQRRSRIAAFDKLFWVLARRFWFRWKLALIIVSASHFCVDDRCSANLSWTPAQ